MSGEKQTPVNPLELSDEAFSKLNGPPANEEEETQNKESENLDKTSDKEIEGDQGNDTGAGGDENNSGDNGEKPLKTQEEEEDPDKKKDDLGSDKTKEGDNLPPGNKDGKDPHASDPTKQKAPAAKDPTDPKAKDKPVEGDGSQKDQKDPAGSKEGTKQDAPVDYKAFYEKVMAPLRANGKTIDLKNPDEAIQLMQMGANYTRKMQQLAPHRKVLLMLENNNLLDEGKLSYLIDLDKRNPEAIKKLIKDAGIDPREIDLEDPQAKPYVQSNHSVSEEDVNFRTTLDELSSNQEGTKTLQTIHMTWDQASKEVLWKQPEVMTLIHQQRESGIYDLIATEIERQRLLGTLPSHVPFLTAYKAIGDQFAEQGKFDHLNKPTTPEPAPKPQDEPRVPVAVRVQKPKDAVENGDKVAAASSTRTIPKKVDTTVNPFALSDDDFMKQVAAFEGRL